MTDYKIEIRILKDDKPMNLHYIIDLLETETEIDVRRLMVKLGHIGDEIRK